MGIVKGDASEEGVPGVLGESNLFNGVLGVTKSNGHAGVAGVSDEGVGNGIYGRSKNANGIIGYSSAEGHSGVAGVNDDGNGPGVYGRSAKYNGIIGYSSAEGHSGVAGVNDDGNGAGVYGHSVKAAGVHGISDLFNGVLGATKSNGHAGVAGVSDEGVGNGIYGRSRNGHAGFFDGNVWVSGELAVGKDITLANADCAEDFEVADADLIEPGTVMVLGEEGVLEHSRFAYDKRVAGVVSGAGEYKPGIVLDRQKANGNRQPIALLGKVYCKADAQYGAIEVGDLLTTSDTPRHAMKAADPLSAFGAVIGKALRPLREGKGLIPILIALQ